MRVMENRHLHLQKAVEMADTVYLACSTARGHPRGNVATEKTSGAFTGAILWEWSAIILPGPILSLVGPTSRMNLTITG